MTKTNTNRHPEFLELGTKHNDQIVLMKELERIEERIDVIGGLILIHMAVVIIGVIGVMIVAH